jgi:hypothetical protein
MTGFGRSTVAWLSVLAGSGGAATVSTGAAGSSFAGDAVSGLGPAPLPSSTATTVFTSTVSPSLNLTSVSVPAAGEGISEQRFVTVDVIAHVLQPLGDGSFRDGLAHLRHYYFSCHDLCPLLVDNSA